MTEPQRPYSVAAPHGRLSLPSPWARQAFTAEDRAVTEALIPDGHWIMVTVSADHRRYHLSGWRRSAADDTDQLVLRWEDRYSPVYAAGLMAQRLTELAAERAAVPA